MVAVKSLVQLRVMMVISSVYAHIKNDQNEEMRGEASIKSKNIKTKFNCECPGGNTFEDIGGTCYYFSSDRGEKHTWDQSRKFCQDIGNLLELEVDLAELGSEASCMSDGLMMQKITKKGEWVWLGGSDAGSENSWRWVTSGRSLSLQDSLWHSDQPNSVGSKGGNCLVGYIHGDYHRSYFGDWHCEEDHYFPCCQVFDQ
ncbi:unnamed protein product, partial [Meganyctiphanes norvegica]